MVEITNIAPELEVLYTRLSEVIDPEVGINIVDLGLVYDVSVEDAAVVVTMTMTTPACPLGPYLELAVEGVLSDVAGDRSVAVEITFEPPWTTELITPSGRSQLGWS